MGVKSRSSSSAEILHLRLRRAWPMSAAHRIGLGGSIARICNHRLSGGYSIGQSVVSCPALITNRIAHTAQLLHVAVASVGAYSVHGSENASLVELEKSCSRGGIGGRASGYALIKAWRINLRPAAACDRPGDLRIGTDVVQVLAGIG